MRVDYGHPQLRKVGEVGKERVYLLVATRNGLGNSSKGRGEVGKWGKGASLYWSDDDELTTRSGSANSVLEYL